MSECLMKETEVALKLQISIWTLKKLRKSGKGPPCIRVGNQIRYVEAAVDEWLKEGTLK
jgi:predicted DNA-binding transcriptional regulator AlpA